MMKLHSVNKEQRLFVMPSGSGFTCYGFDVLDRKGRALTQELARVAAFENVRPASALPADLQEKARVLVVPWKHRKGTRRAFEHYAALLDFAGEVNRRTGYRFTYELTKQLIGLEGRRVEVVTTYDETRRFYVGKSTGFCPCHLEIARRNSTGGGAADHEYKSVRVIEGARHA